MNGIFKQIKTKDIKKTNNKEYTCLKINDKIIVYSNELGFPITSMDLNNGMINFM